MADNAKLINFKGRVQGVGFRYTALRIASRCELTGYVKNLPDGSVEMLAQGDPQDIRDCVDDIKESFRANISDVNINDAPYDNSYESFLITR